MPALPRALLEGLDDIWLVASEDALSKVLSQAIVIGTSSPVAAAAAAALLVEWRAPLYVVGCA